MPLSNGGKFAAAEYAMNHLHRSAHTNSSRATPVKPEQAPEERSPQNPQHASEEQETKEGQPGKQDQSNHSNR